MKKFLHYYIELSGDIAERNKTPVFIMKERRLINYLKFFTTIVDTEDDRIKVYEVWYDDISDDMDIKLVWGFFGYHWKMECEQGYDFDDSGEPCKLIWNKEN